MYKHINIKKPKNRGSNYTPALRVIHSVTNILDYVESTVIDVSNISVNNSRNSLMDTIDAQLRY